MEYQTKVKKQVDQGLNDNWTHGGLIYNAKNKDERGGNATENVRIVFSQVLFQK